MNDSSFLTALRLLLLHRPELDHHRRLLPQRPHLLVGPVLALLAQLDVEIEQELREDQTHLVICKTTLC